MSGKVVVAIVIVIIAAVSALVGIVLAAVGGVEMQVQHLLDWCPTKCSLVDSYVDWTNTVTYECCVESYDDNCYEYDWCCKYTCTCLVAADDATCNLVPGGNSTVYYTLDVFWDLRCSSISEYTCDRASSCHFKSAHLQQVCWARSDVENLTVSVVLTNPEGTAIVEIAVGAFLCSLALVGVGTAAAVVLCC
eukprot:TRINITY_DN15750_c0_g1_i1.p1 TRINITY_DN15750_c0_g1~~TRINITY_DN15750_c0_g1_i1.p1  ORF type:complete len:192 (+),score=40.50 TRINITY_DN15750_c0_g1_i1:493-1068(+)